MYLYHHSNITIKMPYNKQKCTFSIIYGILLCIEFFIQRGHMNYFAYFTCIVFTVASLTAADQSAKPFIYQAYFDHICTKLEQGTLTAEEIPSALETLKPLEHNTCRVHDSHKLIHMLQIPNVKLRQSCMLYLTGSVQRAKKEHTPHLVATELLRLAYIQPKKPSQIIDTLLAHHADLHGTDGIQFILQKSTSPTPHVILCDLSSPYELDLNHPD